MLGQVASNMAAEGPAVGIKPTFSGPKGMDLPCIPRPADGAVVSPVLLGNPDTSAQTASKEVSASL